MDNLCTNVRAKVFLQFLHETTCEDFIRITENVCTPRDKHWCMADTTNSIVQLAQSQVTPEQVVVIVSNLRGYFKDYFASDAFRERVSKMVDIMWATSNQGVFQTKDEYVDLCLEINDYRLATRIEVYVRKAVDSIVAEEAQLKVLEQAKSVIGGDEHIYTSSNATGHVIDCGKLYLVLPAAVLILAAPCT